MTDIHFCRSLDLPSGKRIAVFDGVPIGPKIGSFLDQFTGVFHGFPQTVGIGG